MTNWRELVAAKNWTGVEDLWPHLEQADAAALLDALRSIVPMVTIENGMERTERRALPKEVVPELTGAAIILMLGELEAYVEGDPPLPTAVWRDLKAAAETFLHESSAKAEATQGDIELSRKRHCDEAAESLRSLSQTERLMLGEMDGPDEENWLRGVIAEVAIDAYLAGRHVQAAWGKDFEQHAVRGEKVLHGAAQAGALRRRTVEPSSQRVLEEMGRLLDRKQTVSRAAELAFEGGFGSSPAANQKLYYRTKRKKVGT
jgi:hypothetical protein